MTRFIGIASGKGGTGKTTAAINIAVGLRNLGYDTTLVDANLSTPHVSMHLGSADLPITLNHVLKGENNLHEAVYHHASGIKVIPASVSLEDIDDLNPKRLANILYNADLGDIAVLDLSSSFTSDIKPILSALTDIIIVANPNLPSITEAIKTIRLSENCNLNILGVILNKVSKADQFSPEEAEKILNRKIIASIPDHRHVAESLNQKQPVLYSNPKSPVSQEFANIALFLSGTDKTISPAQPSYSKGAGILDIFRRR